MSLKIEKLSYQIKKKWILYPLNLTCHPGHLYGILGPNGSGKSTFLKLLSGVWKPTTGTLTWKEQSLLDLSRKEFSQIVSLVPQAPSLQFDFTAWELVSMGCYAHSLSKAKEEECIIEKLKLVDAYHLRDRPVAELSGGERQRIYIARSLATSAPILLLDEPTSFLDIKHQREVWTLLDRLVKEENKLIIVALHDFMAAQHYCHEVVLLNEGNVALKGKTEVVLQSKELQDILL